MSSSNASRLSLEWYPDKALVVVRTPSDYIIFQPDEAVWLTSGLNRLMPDIEKYSVLKLADFEKDPEIAS